jgi:tetratricopeptide (TPR) repeat protein
MLIITSTTISSHNKSSAVSSRNWGCFSRLDSGWARLGAIKAIEPPNTASVNAIDRDLVFMNFLIAGRHNTTKNEMTTSEQSYIDRIAAQWPRKWGESKASLALVTLVEEAVSTFPKSAQLWCIRGDLVQLAPIEAQYGLADALLSYQTAIEIDPLFAEAYESIGYYYNVIDEDFAVCEAAFRKAIEFGSGMHSYVGLARVLAEQGKLDEALTILAPDYCPFHSEIEIDILREEIEAGELDRSNMAEK